ncbi:hypothetical protein pb186bvf_005716 [Paramecium bursaria]
MAFRKDKLQIVIIQYSINDYNFYLTNMKNSHLNFKKNQQIRMVIIISNQQKLFKTKQTLSVTMQYYCFDQILLELNSSYHKFWIKI